MNKYIQYLSVIFTQWLNIAAFYGRRWRPLAINYNDYNELWEKA
ncbi:MAG: hypothetical protein ACI909_002960 [Planctomycetota bacterium]